jgi:dipeptidyl-peptidase-4
VITHIPSIGESAQLLLVHGLLDENVHFRHTARLINELIRHKKQYELLLFPSERHTPRMKPDRAYMEQRIADFFQRAFA